MNFRTFVAASVLSRGARFFLVAALLYFFGPPIKEFIERHFEWLTLLLAAGILGGFVVLKRLAPRSLHAAGRPSRGG